MATFEKNLKIFGGGIMLAIVALVFFSVQAQNAVVTSADEFLGLLSQGKYYEAREVSSDEFKNIVTVEQLQGLLEETPEFDMTNVKWETKEITPYDDKEEASLYGIAKTPEGEDFAVKVYLERFEGEEEWKVLGVFFPGLSWEDTSFFEDASEVPAPEYEERKQMALATMELLFDAMETGNFMAFYEEMAEPVKMTSSPEVFSKSFSTFMDNNPEFLESRGKVQLELDDAVDRAVNGVMIMQGRYVLEDLKFEITFQYTHEASRWKLIYIHVGPGEPVE